MCKIGKWQNENIKKMINHYFGIFYQTIEPCILARVRQAPIFYTSRAGLRANFHAIVKMRAGPLACFTLLLILYILDIHQLVMKKNSCSGGNNTSPCGDWEWLDGGLRSNARIRLKLAATPQQKWLPWMCPGEIVRRYFKYLLIH